MLTTLLLLYYSSGISMVPTVTAGQVGSMAVYVILFIVWLVKGQSKHELDSKTIVEHEELLKTQAETQQAQAMLQTRQQVILEQHGERLSRVENVVYKQPLE
jgi:hypothetical protein